MPRNLLGSGVGSWQQETKFGIEREGKNGTEKNWVCVWQGGRQAIQPSPGTGQRWDPGQAVRRVFSSSRGEMKAERRERGQRSGKLPTWGGRSRSGPGRPGRKLVPTPCFAAVKPGRQRERFGRPQGAVSGQSWGRDLGAPSGYRVGPGGWAGLSTPGLGPWEPST